MTEYKEYYENGKIRMICNLDKKERMDGLCIIYYYDEKVYSISYYSKNRLIDRRQLINN